MGDQQCVQEGLGQCFAPDRGCCDQLPSFARTEGFPGMWVFLICIKVMIQERLLLIFLIGVTCESANLDAI